MTAGQVFFTMALTVTSIMLFRWSFQRDRMLGLIVAASLVLRLLGALMFTWYLEAQGREFFADDEMGYLGAGQLIVEGWQRNVQYEMEEGVRAVVLGGYAYWNALLVWVCGPSLLPMRLANGVVGAAGAILAFLLSECFFPNKTAHRAAALLVGLSPSLVVWSLTNLRETFLAVLALATVLSGVSIIKTWGWVRFGSFLGCLMLLGSLRIYYAALLGWLSLGMYSFLSSASLRYKVLLLVPVTLSIGLALQTVTGSFLAMDTTTETLARHIMQTDDGSDSEVEYLTFPPDLGDLGELIVRLPAVLFGRFDSRAGVGLLMSIFLFPEWLATFAILPLAYWGLINAIRQRRYESLLPAAYVCVMVLVLAWTHGDPWTTYRHRATYWPFVLVLAGGGISLALRARTSRSPSLIDTATAHPQKGRHRYFGSRSS